MSLISLNQVFNDGVCRDRGPDTRAETRNIGHSLKSDSSRIWAVHCVPQSQLPSSDDPETRKRMFVGVSWHVTPDMMWRVTAAWHHNTWHQSVTPETEITQNSYPGVTGCYDLWLHLQTQTCDKKWHTRPGCGLRCVLTRVTWPHTDNHWIKFWNLSPGFMINLLIGALQRH